MPTSTTAAEKLKETRVSLGFSQSKLARLSGVSRFKICTFELEAGSFTADELLRVRQALRAEAERLHGLHAKLDFEISSISDERDDSR